MKDISQHKTAILTLATGMYSVLFDSWASHVLANWLPGVECDIHVWTDNRGLLNRTDSHMYTHYMQHKPWPGVVMDKYKVIDEARDVLSAYDSLYNIQVNAMITRPITPSIAYLGEDRLVVCAHNDMSKGMYPKRHKEYAGKDSLAYIPEEREYLYLFSGINGGPSGKYLGMANGIAAMVNVDTAAGRPVPRWHDESYYNRYILDFAGPVRVWPWWFTENEGRPHSGGGCVRPYIRLLNKNKFFGASKSVYAS